MLWVTRNTSDSQGFEPCLHEMWIADGCHSTVSPVALIMSRMTQGCKGFQLLHMLPTPVSGCLYAPCSAGSTSGLPQECQLDVSCYVHTARLGCLDRRHSNDIEPARNQHGIQPPSESCQLQIPSQAARWRRPADRWYRSWSCKYKNRDNSFTHRCIRW